VNRTFLGRTQGSKNKSAKLDEEKVKKIRALFKEGQVSRQELSKQFGVSTSTIAGILSRRTWSHV